jgi:hypothetical protein
LGLDGLRAGIFIGLLIFVAAACGGGGGRPKRLLSGAPAPELLPVRGSVLTEGRVVRRATLGNRFDKCVPAGDAASIPTDAAVVERLGVRNESLTYAGNDGAGVYACDGGADPAGERRPPWCGFVFGERESGRLLDPRLDVNCRDREGHALAYAFVEPIAGAHWIGVQQDGYVEVYEALAGLPVRIATTNGIDLARSRATIHITQYDVAGRQLARSDLEAAVAG